MGDFHQNGSITTLHDFHYSTLNYLEKKLVKFSRRRKMGLIIPALYSELEKPALKNIVNVLKDIPYITEITIGLDQANAEQYQYAKKYFSVLKTDKRRCNVLWNEGPRMMELRRLFEEKKIHPGDPGKGRNVWFCFGYMIASGRSEAIALHDADIITYNREMIARLFYPVADPTFNYKFCKGYYFRSDGQKMNGRVTRLMVTPLIRTLKKIFPASDYLEFIDNLEPIRKKTSRAKKTCRGLIQFFSERAALETAYANKLASLARTGGPSLSMGYTYSILEYKNYEE